MSIETRVIGTLSPAIRRAHPFVKPLKKIPAFTRRPDGTLDTDAIDASMAALGFGTGSRQVTYLDHDDDSPTMEEVHCSRELADAEDMIGQDSPAYRDAEWRLKEAQLNRRAIKLGIRFAGINYIARKWRSLRFGQYGVPTSGRDAITVQNVLMETPLIAAQSIMVAAVSSYESPEYHRDSMGVMERNIRMIVANALELAQRYPEPDSGEPKETWVFGFPRYWDGGPRDYFRMPWQCIPSEVWRSWLEIIRDTEVNGRRIAGLMMLMDDRDKMRDIAAGNFGGTPIDQWSKADQELIALAYPAAFDVDAEQSSKLADIERVFG